MQAPQDLHEGMKVRAADGEDLGKLIVRGADSFTIEKGFFFPKDYVARYEEITDIRDDEIWLRQTRDQLNRGEAAEPMNAEEPPVAAREPATRTPAAGVEEQTRIPLAEEQLETEKRVRDAGDVTVRKEVVTENKQVTVPVTHEEVKVERVPASGEASTASFREGEVRVPLTEEEVEVRKRPVVREEVRVTKTPYEEQKEVEATTRKEQAKIEEHGGAKQAKR